MRISDLSRQSGVPIATIKFYLREGLLPPGARTAHNQAEYGEGHLSRLRLVRMLIMVGHLSLSQVRQVLAAVDMKGLSILGLCHVVNRALFADQRIPPATTSGVEDARMSVDKFLADRGWRVAHDAPGRRVLAQILAALRYLGWGCDVDIFAPLADAAERLTAQEEVLVSPAPAETVVARTVLLEVALTTIRRMAQEHHIAGSPTRGHPLPPSRSEARSEA